MTIKICLEGTKLKRALDIFIQSDNETGRQFDTVSLKDVRSWGVKKEKRRWQELQTTPAPRLTTLNTARNRRNQKHCCIHCATYLWRTPAAFSKLLHSILISKRHLIGEAVEDGGYHQAPVCSPPGPIFGVVLEISCCCICLQLLQTAAPVEPVAQCKPQSWPACFHSRNRKGNHKPIWNISFSI